MRQLGNLTLLLHLDQGDREDSWKDSPNDNYLHFNFELYDCREGQSGNLNLLADFTFLFVLFCRLTQNINVILFVS